MSSEPLAALHDAVSLLMDNTDAFRAAAIQRGYSETVAEQMALEWFRASIRQAFGEAA